jgi:ubiquinone biosynthesis protein
MTFGKARLTRRELQRYGHLLAVLARYGLDDILYRLHARHTMPWRNRVPARKMNHVLSLSTPQRVRLVLEELGPTYVKFGQILSGRPDLLPEDFITELNRLQDDVPSFPFRDVQAIIEGAFHRPLGELYDAFEETPVAAASLAQVHRARMKTGEEVAVKVQRPGLEEIIDADIRVLRRLAALAGRHLPELAFFEPGALVDDFAVSIHHELDFIREGRNADSFRKFFDGDETVHIPKVHWDLSTTTVLTLEYIRGIKVSEHARLEAAGLDPKTIAANGANLILREIFELRRFHADPHPGNLFVLENNVIAPVDYGMTGRLDQERVNQLGTLVTAMVEKDLRTMSTVLLHMCGATDQTQAEALRSLLADLLDRYYDTSLKDFRLDDFINGVTAFFRRHKTHFPGDLAMMARSLIIIEGVGRTLYPDFNILGIMEEYARKLMIRKADPAAIFQDFGTTIADSAALLKALPSDTREILAKLKRDEITIRFDHRGLERMSSVLDKSSNRLSSAVVIAALIIGSSLVFQTGVGPKVCDYPLAGLVGFVLTLILGLWLLVGIMRSGRW